ncbi:MAG: membrane protein [Methanothermobacter thermautotrophicus]|uniref:VIT family protein n=2 Tax=Methanothermobacter TaxID=145260 RepID=O26215_METTH|nr:unknown [Methanothermobacter thermautotrophicus str. Delta H]
MNYRNIMKHSLKTGLSFGLTSAIITTLGLMVGLHSGTHSRLAVIGGVLTIAIADAFSDAMGIHISEEAENVHTEGEIWESTLATFISKFLFALTFLVPVLTLDLTLAIIVSIIWGLLLLTVLSFHIARSRNVPPGRVLLEHIATAIMIIVITHYAGDWISSTFG